MHYSEKINKFVRPQIERAFPNGATKEQIRAFYELLKVGRVLRQGTAIRNAMEYAFPKAQFHRTTAVDEETKRPYESMVVVKGEDEQV